MINRRTFLTAGSAAFAGNVLWRGTTTAERPGNADSLPTPLPRQVIWQDCEVGAIFHFDMPLFSGHRWSGNRAIHETTDPEKYNPTKLDTDQWVAAAKAMGARYALFTATHFNGFLQWQSDLYRYGVKQAAWRNGKGDVVKDFVESCRKENIKPGIYMSCFRNAWWKVNQYRVNKGKGEPGQAEFARTCERMFEELCTRYGELVQIWFDAGNIDPDDGGPDLLPIADKHQPNMVFYHSPRRSEHRWIGNEQGHAGYPCWATMPGRDGGERDVSHNSSQWKPHLYHGDPNGTVWSPGMVDTVLRDHHWFWKPDTEDTIAPLDHLVSFYYQSVGRNANLVLGLTPDPSGLVPEPDLERCEQFGAEIRRRLAHPVAETKGNGTTVWLDLPKPTRIDQVVAMEDISLGERVRKYVLEGRVGGDVWQTLATGSCIGHKRIEQIKPTEVAAVRLRVTQSRAIPRIRKLAAYA